MKSHIRPDVMFTRNAIQNPRLSKSCKHLVLLGVVLGAGLSGQNQSTRSVLSRHVELDKLQAVGGIEVLVGEELVELVLGLNLEGLASLLAAKNADEILVLPVVDVVVDSIHTVDESLNGETIVADDKAETKVNTSTESGPEW